MLSGTITALANIAAYSSGILRGSAAIFRTSSRIRLFRSALFLLLTIIVFLASQSALSQSTNTRDCDNGATSPADNDPERFIGVCHLENTANTITHDDGISRQGELQFSVRSCSTWWGETCEFAIPYTVRLTGDNNGSNFILTRDRGNHLQVEVKLTYESVGSDETLSPSIDGTTLFSGGTNGQQIPAAITVSLINPAQNLSNGTYIGNFELSIEQCGNGYTWGVDPEACDGRYPTTRLLSVPFSIEMRLRTRIQIWGLEDMPLSTSTSGAEGSQTFCVWSTGGSRFRITADSANGNGQFMLQGLDQLPYSATVEHLPTGRSETLSEGVISSSNWPGSTSSNCQNFTNENMQLTIQVQPSDLSAAADTSYADTLTLTVEPD